MSGTTALTTLLDRWLSGLGPLQKVGPRKERWLKILFGAAALALLAYCAIGAVMLTVASAKLIPSQWENMYPESPAIYTGILTARTGQLYYSFSQPPYASQPYGPLYYVLNAAIARFSDLQIDLIVTRGRLLVFFCFCLGGVIVLLIGKRLGFSVASAMLAGLMYLGQTDFYPWNASLRPDMLGILLMLLCLLAAISGKQSGERSYVLPGLLAGLAFLVKQSAVTAAISIVGVLVLNKKYRQAVQFVLWAAAPVALVFVVLFLRREPFLEQFTAMSQGPWSFASGLLWTQEWINDITIMVPLAVGAIGIATAMTANEESQMVGAFALANICVSVAGIAQLGGNTNYFLPTLTACSLLLPFAIRVVREHVRSIVAVLALIVIILWTTSKTIDRQRFPFLRQSTQQEQPYAALRPFHILSDKPYFSLHGREPEFLDPFFLHWLELAGRWDSSPIVREVENGDYDLVILACGAASHTVCNFRGINYFSEPLVDAVNRNYEVLCSTLGARVLKPRFREVEATPAMLGSALFQSCGTGMRGTPPSLVFAQGTR